MQRPEDVDFEPLDAAVFDAMKSFDVNNRADWKADLAGDDKILMVFWMTEDPSGDGHGHRFFAEGRTFGELDQSVWKANGVEGTLRHLFEVFGRARAAGDESATPCYPGEPDAWIYGLGIVMNEKFGTVGICPHGNLMDVDGDDEDQPMSDSFYVALRDGNAYVRRNMGGEPAAVIESQDFVEPGLQLGDVELDSMIADGQKATLALVHFWLWGLLHSLVAPRDILLDHFEPRTLSDYAEQVQAELLNQALGIDHPMHPSRQN